MSDTACASYLTVTESDPVLLSQNGNTPDGNELLTERADGRVSNLRILKTNLATTTKTLTFDSSLAGS